MATRLRLQRHGKKGKPVYHIVAADSRAPRDGRFIEKVGTYNPNTNPATIDLVHDRALHWLQVGAEMSDTTRAILKYKGVVYHNHLINGVKKGAFSAEQAQTKFEQWMREKESKVAAKVQRLAGESEKAFADRLKAEKEVNAKRLAELRAAEESIRAQAAAEEAVESAEEAAVEAEEEVAVEAEAATEAEAEVVAEVEAAPAAEEAAAPVEEPSAPVEEVAAPAEEAPASDEAEAPAEEA
jgi:small subunit ribosomal protein S16